MYVFKDGPNAGHTIYRDDYKLVLHQIPSGIIHNNVQCLIAHGCIVDPKKLINEINMLLQYDNTINIKEKLLIAKNCHIITDEHIKKDTKRENAGKGNGSTKCGISPCYSDKYYREGKRLTDVFFPGCNISKVAKEFDINESAVQLIIDLLIDDTYFINYECNNKHILYEGAQGVFLDIDNPIYPNVSSSHVNLGGVIAGTGINFNKFKYDTNVVGIVKSYMSSVGVGKFLTEIKEPITLFRDFKFDPNILREVGQEYGATTGRPRKIGFLDLVMVKHACDITGIDELCLTRLDTLKEAIIKSGNTKFPVCIGYAAGNERDGYVIESNISWYDIDKYKPVYKMFDLWENIDMYDKNFNYFIKYIENFVNVPIKYCSVGPGQTDIKTF